MRRSRVGLFGRVPDDGRVLEVEEAADHAVEVHHPAGVDLDLVDEVDLGEPDRLRALEGLQVLRQLPVGLGQGQGDLGPGLGGGLRVHQNCSSACVLDILIT
ncbi:MAG: hypothetical protein AB203_01065 [Parcubacteria bacterium C7867-008]|nr:MAG: hypothetical protein AB203_01065 [Parcubacteria bacterium C7867-008]